MKTTPTLYARIWDTLYYLLVVVSWRLTQLWELVDRRSSQSLPLVDKTPPNPKAFNPVLRSRRASSMRRADDSGSANYGYYRRATPVKGHFNRNVLHESFMSPSPRKALFEAPSKLEYGDDDLSFTPLLIDNEVSRIL